MSEEGKIAEFLGPTLSALKRVLDPALSLAPIARLTGCALANRLGKKTGVAWPSIATLASDTGLSRSTIKRGLAALIRARVFERYRDGRRTWVYRLRTQSVAPRKVQSEPPEDGGVHSERARGSRRASKGFAVNPQGVQSEPLSAQEHAHEHEKRAAALDLDRDNRERDLSLTKESGSEPMRRVEKKQVTDEFRRLRYERPELSHEQAYEIAVQRAEQNREAKSA